MSLPKWPEKPPKVPERYIGMYVSSFWAEYERARADAAMARLRLLQERAIVVVIEYRREFDRGELIDVDELEDALVEIGPLEQP